MKSKFSKALVLLLTLALVATQLMVPAFATETLCTCDESTRTGTVVSSVAATCDTYGIDTMECDECGGTFLVVTANPNPALHVLVPHAGQAADCTEGGWLDYETCANCSYTTYEAIDALGHDYVPVVTAPDCDDAGYTTHTCSRCSDSYVDTPVDALGHTEGAPVEENIIGAVCGVDGSKEIVVYCSVCGEELSREKVKTDDALEHDWVVDSIDAPGAPDRQIHYVCNQPGCPVGTKDVYMCEGEHAYVNTITQEQTCLLPEITKHVCTVCEYEFVEETKPAKGHTEVVDAAVAPTCTETGLTAGSHCDVCSEILVAQTVVPALDHDYVAVVTAPTCTADGFTTHTCSRCNDTYTDTPVAKTPDLHKAVITKEAVDPTCTAVGYTYELSCANCQVVLYKQLEVAALGHDYVDHSAQAPDCTNVGWNAYQTCSRCDYTSYTEIPANGHTTDYTVGVVQPKCDAEGYTVEHCEVCLVNFKTDYVDALGHDYVDHDAQEVTCLDIGWDAYQTCTRCAYTTYVEKAALGHDHVAVVTAPTCTTDGFTTHTCSRCDDSYTDTPVAALGHTAGTPVDENVVAPTCTADGTKDVVTYCSVCNEELSRTPEITGAALGHLNDIVLERVEPTYDETGLEEGVKCSACGVDTTPQVVIPRKSEEINFTYEATGINGTEVAVNSGKVFVNVYMNVTSDFARLYAFDLEYTFDPELVLVDAKSEAFDVIDYNAVGNTVMLSPNMGLNAEGKKYEKGKYLVATLTFEVDSAFFSDTADINFVAGDFARDTDVLKNALNVDFGTGVGIEVVKLGDANNDGDITSKDTLELAKWIGAADEGDYDAIYDLNKDGKINGDDFALMRKAAVGNTDYLD